MTVVHLLRGHCSKHPKLWEEQLHYVQHAYNYAMHSSIQISHFKTCLGYFPKSPMGISFEKEGEVNGQNDANKAKRFIQKIQQVH